MSLFRFAINFVSLLLPINVLFSSLQYPLIFTQSHIQRAGMCEIKITWIKSSETRRNTQLRRYNEAPCLAFPFLSLTCPAVPC
jgi:hypothetical protein